MPVMTVLLIKIILNFSLDRQNPDYKSADEVMHSINQLLPQVMKGMLTGNYCRFWDLF
jgi:hypothetical protein